MRGTKLSAWRVPPVWNEIQTGAKIGAPENSQVLAVQKDLLKAAQKTLEAIAADVREGLLETVGIDCALVIDERCAVSLDLPDAADAKQIAQAIDLENVEAWRDENGLVRVGISPWLSTKDVDQTVLCAVKVIHVLLGIHAADNAAPPTFGQKILSTVAEIMNIQKKIEKR